MSGSHDVVVVGSGINSLACAALLARGGKRVLVLERNDYLGGAIRTAEITEPGFVHEVFSSWHPLFVGSSAYAELQDELGARGLEYLNTDLPTGTLLADGSSAFLTTSHEANVAERERHAVGDGAAWDRTVSEFMPHADLSSVLTTELWSAGRPQARGRARCAGWQARGARVHGGVLASCRDGRRPRSVGAGALPARALGAPPGLGPDPRPRLHDARDRRGRRARRDACAREGASVSSRRSPGSSATPRVSSWTGADVEQVVVRGGRAAGVLLAGGRRRGGAGRGRRERHPDAALRPALTDVPYRAPCSRPRGHTATGGGDADPHGRSRTSALGGDERLGRDGVVHLTPRARRCLAGGPTRRRGGCLPADRTIVVGQPLAVDPSRAPEGSWIVLIQLQELCRRGQGRRCRRDRPG